MSSKSDALVHIECALKSLSLHAEVLQPGRDWQTIDHFTIAEDLKRIDSAIGPKGASVFARIADSIQEAYTEILAAKKLLSNES